MAALDSSAFDASAIAKAQDETLAEAERLNVLPAPEKTPYRPERMPAGSYTAGRQGSGKRSGIGCGTLIVLLLLATSALSVLLA